MPRPSRPRGTPTKNTIGLTSTEYDGVGTPDLRRWLKYWCDEESSRDEARRLRLDRDDEIRRLMAEINARVEAGRARKRVRSCADA